MLTKELVERAVPATLKSSITQELVDRVNASVADPIVAEQIRENFIHYVSVLKEGKFKTEDYLSAVMYVSFKLMGDSNGDAYMKTFPERYQDLLARGVSPKDRAAYVAAYARGKLVNLVLEQSMVPTYVLNQHMFQEALNTQFDLMQNATSEKVRTEAANSILTHLKRPEVAKSQIDINLKDSSGMTEMKEAMRKLAMQQQQAITQGHTARDIAAESIIDADYVEVTE